MMSRMLAQRGALLLAIALLGVTAAAWAEDPPPDAATREYNSAVRLQNLGSYDLAAEAWKTYREQYATDPRVGRATHYLGVCYYQLGQLDAAVATFREVIDKKLKLEADLAEANLLYLGIAQYGLAQGGKAELYDQAAETFKSLLDQFASGKSAPDALFYRGECLYLRDHKPEAAAAYTQLIAAHASHKFVPDAMYALGVIREEQGQADAAGKTYDDFLAKYADHPLAAEVTLRRGETLFAARQFAEAAKRFEAAAAKSGFALADYATLRRAESLAQLKQYPEAAALYASIPGKFAGSQHAAKATLAAGKCYYLAGNHAEAQRLLKQAVDAGGPGLAEAAHWTAKSLLKENKAAEALAVVEKALPQAGDSEYTPALKMDQADAVYATPGRRKDAVALFAALAEQHPKDPLAPQALYMAGFAALEENMPDEGLKHATKFLATFAGNELTPDVMHVAAESHLLLKQYAEAEKLYSELLQKHAGHADANLWRVRQALTLQLQGKHAETLAAMQPATAGLGSADLVAEGQYLIGVSQLEQGQIDEAIKSLSASLAARPKWRLADETLLALAAAHRRKNDAAKAKELAARLIADFPDSKVLDRAHYRLGEYCYLLNDYAGAMAAYRTVIDTWGSSPLAPHALHELGCAQLHEKDAAGAEQTLTKLLTEHQGHALMPRARYARGMARQQTGNFQGAAEDLQASLGSNPTGSAKSDVLYVLGLSQLGLKQYDEAAKTFATLLDGDPQYSGADNAIYQRAWALKLGGKEPEAAEAFAKLTEGYANSPRAPEARYHVGEYAFKQKDYKKAAKEYYLAHQKGGPELGEKASHKLGWSYFHLGDFVNAQKTFRFQQGSYPNGPLFQDALFMEAESFFKQNKWDESLALYDKVEKTTSPEFEVLRLLHAGQAAAQLKQWPKSLDVLTRALQSFPDAQQAPELMYEQAWAYQNLGQADKALPIYEQVIAKTNREVAARAQFMIGELQFQRKDHAEAVKSFFKVTYGYGYPKWQAEAAFEAARCFEALGKKDQAIKLYQELIDKYAESDKVAIAKQRIEELKK